MFTMFAVMTMFFGTRYPVKKRAIANDSRWEVISQPACCRTAKSQWPLWRKAVRPLTEAMITKLSLLLYGKPYILNICQEC